ncbi:MAG: PKD domain-containing protein [Planctomycetes bacterium]|jgi:PKD repeat protein|nr:PKD domain-containing protein [Planctomycetota bacterium]
MHPKQTSLLLLASTLLLGHTAAQTIATSFVSNAGSSTNHVLPGCTFDVTVTNPNGLRLDQVVVNSPWPNTTGVLEIYTTDVGNTHVGNLVAPAAGIWQLRAITPFLSAGQDAQTPITLSKPVHLQFGTQGMAIVHRGAGMRWINPGSTGTPLVYTNADLTLSMGSAQSNTFTSTPNTPRIACIALNYVAAVDFVDFTASVRSGPAPHSVTFTNRSSIVSAAVTSWEWDFDGDGIVDSTQQNPTHVYTGCGNYSPKLRVLTAGGNFEYQWTDLIEVDPLVANFTTPTNLVAPQTPVSFSDTSTGATSWQWDFDNDGVVDDTTQNPTWTPGAGSYTVTLTVGNGCRTKTIRKRLDAVTNSFTTGYTGTAGLASKQGIAFFDLQITSAEALVVTGLDTCSATHVGNSGAVKVWLTDGTAAGKQTDATVWREAANGSGATVGTTGGVRIALDRPILLLPGRTYGVAVNYLDLHAYYTSPGLATQTAPDFVVNFQGVANAATPFSATPVTRQWNGALVYTKVGSWPVGAISPVSVGCAGSLGVPSLRPVGTTRPQLGTTFGVELGGMPFGIGLLIVGTSNTIGPIGPLPLDLSFLGLLGCPLLVSNDVTSTVVAAGPAGAVSFGFPAVPSFAGFQFYMQGLTIDPAANPFGAAMSDSVALVTGLH